MICPNTGRNCEKLDYVASAERSFSEALTVHRAIDICGKALHSQLMVGELPRLDCGVEAAAMAHFVLESEAQNA